MPPGDRAIVSLGPHNRESSLVDAKILDEFGVVAKVPVERPSGRSQFDGPLAGFIRKHKRIRAQDENLRRCTSLWAGRGPRRSSSVCGCGGRTFALSLRFSDRRRFARSHGGGAADLEFAALEGPREGRDNLRVKLGRGQ